MRRKLFVINAAKFEKGAVSPKSKKPHTPWGIRISPRQNSKGEFYVSNRGNREVGLGILNTLPDQFRADGVYLAGGIWRTMFDKYDEICDLDFFFRDRASLMACMKIMDRTAEKKFTCPQGLLNTYNYKGYKIQLISNMYHPTASSVIEDFDLDACCAVLDCHTNDFTFKREFIRNVKTKKLTLNKVTYPAATFKRMMKYAEKGFNINRAIEDYIRCINPNIFADFMKFYID